MSQTSTLHFYLYCCPFPTARVGRQMKMHVHVLCVVLHRAGNMQLTRRYLYIPGYESQQTLASCVWTGHLRACSRLVISPARLGEAMSFLNKYTEDITRGDGEKKRTDYVWLHKAPQCEDILFTEIFRRDVFSNATFIGLAATTYHKVNGGSLYFSGDSRVVVYSLTDKTWGRSPTGKMVICCCWYG